MDELNNQNMLQVGTILHGTYKIESYLSSGGFGNTYLAKNIEFDETYAIKEFFVKGVCQRDGNSTTISVSNAENTNSFEQQREKFKKEARRLRSLSNPHIVKVYDLFEENGTAYYVMDYVDGENLSARLKRTNAPLTESAVRNYLNQILDGLEAIHNEGMFHLDIKPANIMVDSHDVVKLIDFGASKQQSTVGGATMSTGISYTNGYAPSEQMAQSYDKFGPWTDFYALGATVYKLLTNQDPPSVSDLSEDDTEDKHLALPMPNVSEEMKKLVVWMMQVNRLKRPKNVGEIRKMEVKNNIAKNNMSSCEETIYKANRDNISSTVTELKETQPKSHKILYFLFGAVVLIIVIGGLGWASLPSSSERYAEAENIIEGKVLENGVYLKADSTKALPVIKELVDKKYGSAMWMYAQYYFNGSSGIQKDSIEGLSLLREAFGILKREAQDGDKYAQCSLSSLYSSEYFNNVDNKKAFYWMQKSADQGYDDAMSNLGGYYIMGIGCAVDMKKGFSYIQKSYELGNPSAGVAVASLYLLGAGVEVDTLKAVDIYESLANKKFIPSYGPLGNTYFKMGKYEKAFDFNTLAAKEGDWEAQENLALAYINGLGVSADINKAIYWMKKAVEVSEENADCLYGLATCYDLNNQYEEAFVNYKKSAEKGYAPSQYQLAVCYQQGIGVKSNAQLAQSWYDKAIANGYKEDN